MLFDLLTSEEESVDVRTRHLRFDIGMLAHRMVAVTKWITRKHELSGLNIGYFGASTGAAAALVAAAKLGSEIGAVASRGGRPYLADEALALVKSPVLLIVGGRDEEVIELNRVAYERLNATKELKIVPCASHLFEEPGTLDAAAKLASDWFKLYLS